MKPASGAVCSTLAFLSVLHGAAAQDNAGLKPITPKGCFSSSEGLEDQGSYTFQTSGYCQEKCVAFNKPVMALAGGSNCWCGDLLPVASSKTSDSECDKTCQGYPDEKCTYSSCLMNVDHANVHVGGGENAWTVLLTGLNNNVGSVQDSSSDSDSNSNSDDKPKPPSTAPTSTAAAKGKPTSPSAANAEPDTTKDKPPSTVTRAATVVVTAPGETQPAAVSAETQAPSKGPNTGGIVAGVVVGIVAILAIAGGLFFFLRNRKRRAVEEEFQRNNVNNPFEIESKPPQSSHSMSDSRLEPSVMMQRRQSDGSIADNQDYSRRILKVGHRPPIAEVFANTDFR
ncbi:MAG: hypothetical protein Q9210_001229 [Variospora velana]